MEYTLNLKADRVIRVAQPTITDKEMKFVQDALISNQLSCGPRNEAFERRFAQTHNRKYGVTCNSGTTALMLALHVMGVEGGKVQMPTLTMVACPNAVLAVGAEPVFVDSEPETGNAELRHSRSVDAYIAVHLYGVPATVDNTIKNRVVSDCAEAHFATYENGKSVGEAGRLSCFSLFSNKIVCGLGEGGIVLTDEDEIADRLKSLRAHAFTKNEHFHHKEFAWGCRLNEPSAAFALAQLERKDSILKRRAEIASLYQQHLSGIWWLETLMRPPGSAWWVYPVLIRKGSKYTKDEVRRYLHEHGVETRSFFKPMHLQPHLKQFATGKYPVAEMLWQQGFYLGIHFDMSESDVAYTADLLGRL